MYINQVLMLHVCFNIFCLNNAHLEDQSSCEGKDEALGMENGSIADFQITSSTAWSLPAKKGRLNGRYAWAADKNDRYQWIQVDLGEPKFVTKIATQGRPNQWATTYNISYSSNGQAFDQYQVDNVNKVRK